MSRKGILLAGGRGKRFYPVTIATNKHLLAVYDKPMFFYPLSMLMLAGIREILLITTPRDIERFQSLLGDGSCLGLSLVYAAQPRPKGIPDAFFIGEKFLDGAPCCLILGDNVFHGQGLGSLMRRTSGKIDDATIFCYQVDDPREFGVAVVDQTGKVLAVEEKPQSSSSCHAITGLYFFDGEACQFARTLRPSARNELEIVDLLRCYMDVGRLWAETLRRGTAWMDMGTPRALLMAADYIRALDTRQRMKIACLEEIAWYRGWIDDSHLGKAAEKAESTDYGRYLRNLLAAGRPKS